MEVLYPRCAGLDVHANTIVACARVASGSTVARTSTKTSGPRTLPNGTKLASRTACSSPFVTWASTWRSRPHDLVVSDSVSF